MIKLIGTTITTSEGGWHPTIKTSKHGDQHFCGYSWCSGKCGLPALVIPADGERPEYKVMGSMVAYGAAAQPWRVKWEGQKVEVDNEDREHLLRQYWI